MTLMVSEHTFAAIDFESAGADRGKTDVPVQIGMATWSLPAGHADHFTSFIRADQNITWSAQKVHGISRDDLADAPALMLLWPSIKATLSDRVVWLTVTAQKNVTYAPFPITPLAHGLIPCSSHVPPGLSSNHTRLEISATIGT